MQATVEASKPWNFSQDMSATVFGNSVFRTDYGKGGNIDLPFPPERVWCVLLERGTTEADRKTGYEVVFVNLHNDNVWWLDWVVHEGTGDLSSQEFSETMELIGCDPEVGREN
jgi:hypothetical protein